MHALIVHCHPEPSSFNGALTQVATETLEASGATVDVSDLYRDAFDPCEGPRHYAVRDNTEIFAPLGEQRHAYQTDTLSPDVAREIERLKRADLVIFQFPIWWHSHPAVLKGWFDRVFVSGGLYTSEMRYDRGVFRGKRAICSITTGAQSDAFGPGCRGGDIEKILWPTHYSLYYMGFDVLPPHVTYGVQNQNMGYAYQSDADNERHLKRCLEGWAKQLSLLCDAVPLRFAGWDDWDDNGQARGRTGQS
ncbi:MAG: NAD(P)H-dependent oxidoreductase [Pseudomonadota bacterium]